MLSHDDIREMFPEYIRGALPGEIKDELESHLKGCRDCRDELSFISELIKAEAPDPGELFWKTLPDKVMRAVGKEKSEVFSIRSFLFRPLPAAVAIAVLFSFFLAFIFLGKKEKTDTDPFFKDPFTVSVLYYGDVTDKDIPMTIELTDNEPYTGSENFIEYSYREEFASLGTKELMSLYEALGEEQKKGG